MSEPKNPACVSDVCLYSCTAECYKAARSSVQQQNEERIALLDSYDLREEARVIRQLGLSAGWKRAIFEPTKRPGFIGVVRHRGKVIWKSAVSIWSSPSDQALPLAIDELRRRAFDAWKAEKGLK